MDDLAYAFTEPVRQFARKRGFSVTTVYAWINSGELESFLEGHRRHVVLASYARMVRRRVAEQGSVKLPSSNPKAKARQATSFEGGNQDASAQPPDSPVVPPRPNRGARRLREMTVVGRAAQHEPPSIAAAAPRKRSANAPVCSDRSAFREADGGSDSTEALAAALSRDAHGGGQNGGPIIPPTPRKHSRIGEHAYRSGGLDGGLSIDDIRNI